MFGQTPAKFREQKPEVVLEKRLVITPEMLEHLNGGIQLVPNIITLPARLFAGQETEYQNHIVPGSDYNKTLTPFWRQFIKRIPSIPNRKGKHAVGVARSQSQKFEENRATYLACIEVETLEGLADDLIPYQIPETQYAVFTNKGTGEKTFYTANYIYGTWLPLSDYLRADGDDLEYFDHRYHLSNRDSLSDYYLPIVKNS
ncbi:MAG: effector binding domain-containing protein [Halobacteriovoraceae bacterium]|nr:effector binding domain-containing protein [Halobacteriovoraceae bacterium]